MSPFAILNSWLSEMSLGAEFDPGRGPIFEGGIFVCFFGSLFTTERSYEMN